LKFKISLRINKGLNYNLLVVIAFASCSEAMEEGGTKKTQKPIADIEVEIYRSTEDSYQRNFFLKINGDSSTFYGWEINDNSDTIYYRSITKVEKDNNGYYRFHLK
jgi:hypothetical protein